MRLSICKQTSRVSHVAPSSRCDIFCSHSTLPTESNEIRNRITFSVSAISAEPTGSIFLAFKHRKLIQKVHVAIVIILVILFSQF